MFLITLAYIYIYNRERKAYIERERELPSNCCHRTGHYNSLNTLSGSKSCLVAPGVAVPPWAIKTVLSLLVGGWWGQGIAHAFTRCMMKIIKRERVREIEGEIEEERETDRQADSDRQMEREIWTAGKNIINLLSQSAPNSKVYVLVINHIERWWRKRTQPTFVELPLISLSRDFVFV